MANRAARATTRTDAGGSSPSAGPLPGEEALKALEEGETQSFVVFTTGLELPTLYNVKILNERLQQGRSALADHIARRDRAFHHSGQAGGLIAGALHQSGLTAQALESILPRCNCLLLEHFIAQYKLFQKLENKPLLLPPGEDRG